jgi:hypothetical protein
VGHVLLSRSLLNFGFQGVARWRSRTLYMPSPAPCLPRQVAYDIPKGTNRDCTVDRDHEGKSCRPAGQVYCEQHVVVRTGVLRATCDLVLPGGRTPRGQQDNFPTSKCTLTALWRRFMGESPKHPEADSQTEQSRKYQQILCLPLVGHYRGIHLHSRNIRGRFK